MTDLVQFPNRRGGTPPPPPEGPASDLSIVKHVQATFLVADTRRRKLRKVLSLATAGSALSAPLETRGKPPASRVAVAKGWLEDIPPEAELLAAADLFEAALDVQARPLEIGAVAAWLVDSYPNRRVEVGATFVDTLELILDDADEILSAAVLAATVRKLIEDSTFLPTGAEFLAAALRMRNTFRGAALRARHLVEMRNSALDVAWNAGLLTRVEYGLPEQEDDTCPF